MTGTGTPQPFVASRVLRRSAISMPSSRSTSVTTPAPSRPSRRILLHATLCTAGALLGALGHHLTAPALAPPPPSAPHSAARPLPPAPTATPRTAAPASTAAAALPSVESSATLDTLTTILGSRRNDLRKAGALVAWADTASEADLKLALTVGPQAAQDDAQLEVLDSVILARLAEIDGPMALQVMNALERDPDHAISPEAQRSLFESWVAWDPQGAAHGALAQLQKDPEEFGSTMEYVISEIGREFPWLARDVASRLARADDPDTRQLGFRAHADLMLAGFDQGGDHSAALAWIAATHVSADERQYLLRELLAHDLDVDDRANALRVFRQLDPAKDPALTVRLIRELTSTDPQTSAQLVLTLPAGKIRRTATAELTGHLLEHAEPGAVLGWLAAQPTHADFDQAFVRLADAFDGTDPQNAWRCVAKLTDDAANKQLLSFEFGFKWLKADFAQASRELPPDFVDRYRRSDVLLQQLAELFPEAKHDFSLNWRDTPSLRF